MSGWAEGAEDKAVETSRPGYGVVIADVVFVRPLTFVAMVAGAAIWVVTIPVTAPTGTIGEAGYTLVAEPAVATFARCLGCTEAGWRKLPKKEADE